MNYIRREFSRLGLLGVPSELPLPPGTARPPEIIKAMDYGKACLLG